jgi:2-polyprenyl-3-methyl-5-hydroxy-6-metoxy-1,4-benzoquinol methylase
MAFDHKTPEIWDKVWRDYSLADFEIDLAQERDSIRFQYILDCVTRDFGGFRDLKVVEIGAGRGLVTLLMCQLGANGTVIDYSEDALTVAREFYSHFGVEVSTVCMDAFDLSKDLHQAYDISMSFGLAEHFSGARRQAIFQAHSDLLRTNGMSFISVPNAACFPYRVFKATAEALDLWRLGTEIPFTRQELNERASAADFNDIDIVGSSFPISMSKYLLVDPLSYASRKVLGRDLFHSLKKMPERPRRNKRRFWINDVLGYSLTLKGRRG